VYSSKATNNKATEIEIKGQNKRKSNASRQNRKAFRKSKKEKQHK
jgi:hypothetical protein